MQKIQKVLTNNQKTRLEWVAEWVVEKQLLTVDK